MKIIIEYSMITDEEFFERSKKFYIWINVKTSILLLKILRTGLKIFKKIIKVTLYISMQAIKNLSTAILNMLKKGI